MAPLFDPALFIRLPGGNAHLARSDLAPCPRCGEATFEVVLHPNGRVTCECPACCKLKAGARVVGAVSMTTGRVKEVRP